MACGLHSTCALLLEYTSPLCLQLVYKEEALTSVNTHLLQHANLTVQPYPVPLTELEFRQLIRDPSRGTGITRKEQQFGLPAYSIYSIVAYSCAI